MLPLLLLWGVAVLAAAAAIDPSVSPRSPRPSVHIPYWRSSWAKFRFLSPALPIKVIETNEQLYNRTSDEERQLAETTPDPWETDSVEKEVRRNRIKRARRFSWLQKVREAHDLARNQTRLNSSEAVVPQIQKTNNKFAEEKMYQTSVPPFQDDPDISTDEIRKSWFLSKIPTGSPLATVNDDSTGSVSIVDNEPVSDGNGGWRLSRRWRCAGQLGVESRKNSGVAVGGSGTRVVAANAVKRSSKAMIDHQKRLRHKDSNLQGFPRPFEAEESDGSWEGLTLTDEEPNTRTAKANHSSTVDIGNNRSPEARISSRMDQKGSETVRKYMPIFMFSRDSGSDHKDESTDCEGVIANVTASKVRERKPR
eukprot:jgi/Bigna1/71072/fgenesh1_pg.14_\